MTQLTVRMRAILVCIILSVFVCLVAGLFALQSFHDRNDLYITHQALGDAQTRWNTARITHYHLIIEQRISNTWTDPRKNFCRQDIEVKDQAVISAASTTCPSFQELTIPDLFMTINGIVSSNQFIRQASVRDTQYNSVMLIENTLALPCGASEMMNYRVNIAYDQKLGYPHLIRYSNVNKSAAEQLATQLGFLPRCSAAMGTLPEIRVILFEPLP